MVLGSTEAVSKLFDFCLESVIQEGFESQMATVYASPSCLASQIKRVQRLAQ